MTATENKENTEGSIKVTTNEVKDNLATDVLMTEASKAKQDEENETYSSLEHQYKEMNVEELKKLLASEEVSKNQKKKIWKQIKWIENADKRRERRQQRKRHYKEMREKTGVPKRPKLEKVSTDKDFDSHHHIAIDLSFDELMTNKDIRKLGKQIGWCYKVNRRSSKPVQYHLCGVKERLKKYLDPTHGNWDLHYDGNLFDNNYTDKLVYLTAESPNVLTTFEPGKVYVIGGLVDHNHQKGVCQKSADENNIKTAHLPLQENIDIKSRKVLTINHVFEILLAYRELGNWKEAILKILPAKKLSQEQEEFDSSSSDEEMEET